MIIHCHRNHHNDTYGWSCVPLVDWEKACWFDPECEETLAPDHKGEDREDHEGEFDGDYVEAENRVLGVNRKYWIAACCFKKWHGPKSLLSSQNISKLLLGGEGSGPWGLSTERAFIEIWPTWIFSPSVYQSRGRHRRWEKWGNGWVMIVVSATLSSSRFRTLLLIASPVSGETPTTCIGSIRTTIPILSK